MFQDPEVSRWVGAIGYHPYPYGSTYVGLWRIIDGPAAGIPDNTEVTNRHNLRAFAQSKGKPLWMTEISAGNVYAPSGRVYSIFDYDAFRARAVHIRDEMEYADAAAYVAYRWGSCSICGRHGVEPLQDDQVVYVDTDTDTVYIGNLGWAMGHWSRWIKRGAVRIGDTSSDPLVMPIAWRQDATRQLIFVVINNDTAARQISVTLSGLQVTGDVTGEQSTSTGGYWKTITPFTPENATSITTSLPARSVTTFVASIDEPTPGTAATATATAVYPTWTPDGTLRPATDTPTETGTPPPTQTGVPTQTLTPLPADRLDANCDKRISAADLPAMERLIVAGAMPACSLELGGDNRSYDVTDLFALIEVMFE
jgi:glucosylceramidase